MKQLIMATLLVVFASTSVAAIQNTDIDLSDLTDSERATLVQNAEAMRDAKVATPAVSAAEAKEWVSFGTEIGRGLADTAKELGVAANELLTTPVGMLTAGLIVWHIAGNDIVGVVFGGTWLIAFSIVWLMMYRRFMYTTTVQHFNKGEGPGGAKKVVVKDRIRLEKDSDGWMFVIYVVVLVVGIAIGVGSIF